jgi:uncharacterized repeat protein (TIGR02543 family)
MLGCIDIQMVKAQLVNDVAYTGPLQPVEVNVVHNDVAPCPDYGGAVIIKSVAPSGAGTAVALPDGYIGFTPSSVIVNAAAVITYAIDCGGTEQVATLTVNVLPNSLPANVIMPDQRCIAPMTGSVAFTPAIKYYGGWSMSNNNADAVYYGEIPLVGDLNGDGKPEIVCMGARSGGCDVNHPYLKIYNGQTGERMLEYNCTNGATRGRTVSDVTASSGRLNGLPGSTNSDNYYLSSCHQNPTRLAIADIDHDGRGEIIIATTGYNESRTDSRYGGVYCLRPNWLMSAGNTSGVADSIDLANPLTLVWRSTTSNGSNWHSPKEDNTYAQKNSDIYQAASPTICDINGDGHAEVIVLNKIYNAETGRLITTLETLPTHNDYTYIGESSADATSYRANYAYVGRIPSSSALMYNGRSYTHRPVIVDIDDDGYLDIVAGSKIYKMKEVNGVPALDRIIHGPFRATVPVGTNMNTEETRYLTDGFTGVADMDGDGKLDVVVMTAAKNLNTADPKFIIYMWSPSDGHVGTTADPCALKAATILYTDGLYGTFSMPFIGDINGLLDDYTGTKKLPEFCFVTGNLYINGYYNSTTYFTRVTPHPLATQAGNPSLSQSEAFAVDGTTYNGHTGYMAQRSLSGINATRFNGRQPEGYVLAFTYHADASTPLWRRFKLAWAMETNDDSDMTGITTFDFDNNGTADICYRDETSLRVISPPLDGNRQKYIHLDNTTSPQVMFRANVRNGTALEYPVIADVNMDGSADIAVIASRRTGSTYESPDGLGWANNSDETYYSGRVFVFEHAPGTDKWAPCPPVWNQAFYDPRLIDEDLTVPTRPVSMLQKFWSDAQGDSIQPYNGQWKQQPIVKYGESYTPVVRNPDANLIDMDVHFNGTNTEVSLTVFNQGSASINASTPIAFYDCGTSGVALADGALKDVQPTGYDVFPNETVTLTYTLTGDYANPPRLIRARMMDDGANFPATGYEDCNLDNNALSGSDCPSVNSTVYFLSSDTVLCGRNASVILCAHYFNNPPRAHTYQWYRNNQLITGATDSTLTVTETGSYRCFIAEDVCRAFSNSKYVRIKLLPDVEALAAQNLFHHYDEGDSIVADVALHNRGDETLLATYYISGYCNTVTPASLVASESVLSPLPPDATDTVQLIIHNISALLNETLYIRLNDRGVAAYEQEECDTSNNAATFRPAAYLRAVRDNYVTTQDNPVIVKPLDNDYIPSTATLSIIKPPANGAIAIDGSQGVYTPSEGFAGRDTALYQITDHSGNTSTANIYIYVNEKPDNIVDSTCFTTPPAMNWTFGEQYSSYRNLSPYQSVVVGDIDGDSIVEIISLASPQDGSSTATRWADTIAIFKGTNIDRPYRTFKIEQNLCWDYRLRFGIVRTLIDGRDTALIVIAESDRYLRAYNHEGVKVWESDAVYHASVNNGVNPTFADFNGDGIPEIAIAGSLFDSRDGSLICAIPSGCPFINDLRALTVNVADLFNEGRLNYIMGLDIYDVITDGANNITALTLRRRLTPPTDFSLDPDYSGGSTPVTGFSRYRTLVADFDRDGRLDVLVAVYLSSKNALLFIADPATGAVKAKKYIPKVEDFGYPFVGDIDAQDDQLNEILLIKGTATASERLIMAFKYDPASDYLSTFWTMPHSDGSNCTGITMFDFNQDGIAEIVYRDETTLRIIDGSAETPSVKVSRPNYSGTSGEYPVIADVDGDGQAEIIIAGGRTSGESRVGRLFVYKSADPESPWAPTRKVWNQYAYHPALVRDDLSIPSLPASPATYFPGADGELGTADDVQPYNNYLQQQTTLSHNGLPIWLLPDVLPVVVANEYHYYGNGDSLVVRAAYTNNGDAAMPAPIYFAAYRNVVMAENCIASDSVMEPLFHNASDVCDLVIRNYSSLLPLDTVIIRINDRGEASYVHEECDTAGNDCGFNPRFIIRAYNDFFSTVINNPVLIRPLDNDSVPTGGGQPASAIIVSPPLHGTLLPDDADFTWLYTPFTDYTGGDTLLYTIADALGNFSTAAVYVNIAPRPDVIGDHDCFGAVEAFDWSIRRLDYPTVAAHSYFTPLVGDVDDDGKAEIITAYTSDGYYSDYLTITDGETGAEEHRIPIAHIVSPYMYAVAKVGDTTHIFVPAAFNSPTVGERLYVFAYKYDRTANTWSQAWKSDLTYDKTPFIHGLTTVLTDSSSVCNTMVADVNGDGVPEVIVGNRIYNARTGVCLARLPKVTHMSQVAAAGDILNNGKTQIVLGGNLYSINITNPNGFNPNALTLEKTAPATSLPLTRDNLIADFNLDGYPDVLYVGSKVINSTSTTIVYAVWDVHNNRFLGNKAYETPTVSATGGYYVWWSTPLIGDINNDGYPEFVFMTYNRLTAVRYDAATDALVTHWTLNVNDRSGATGIVLFDFDQNGSSELVYRDEQKISIINGASASTAGTPLQSFTGIYNGTGNEAPVVADVNNDGQAELLSVGSLNALPLAPVLQIFGADGHKWAAARKVWNQYNYNGLNINEDLTVPAAPASVATRFPGANGLLGDADDVRPFNAFLQQLTPLNRNGNKLWLLPDAAFASELLSVEMFDADSALVTACITNHGEAALQPPLYVSLYHDSVSAETFIHTDSIMHTLHDGGDTACVVFRADVRELQPFARFVARLNDLHGAYPVQAECLTCDSAAYLRNPAPEMAMRLKAFLNGEPHDGDYPNPASLLYSDTVTFTITAVNTSLSSDSVVVADLLPMFFDFADNVSAEPPLPDDGFSLTQYDGGRALLRWRSAPLAPLSPQSITFTATPVSSATVASQPLFVNHARVYLYSPPWEGAATYPYEGASPEPYGGVLADGAVRGVDGGLPTNATYHQGAGVAIVSFAAGEGGSLVNDDPQPVDFGDTPRSGVLVIPDEGYRFVGWSVSSDRDSLSWRETISNTAETVSTTADYTAIPVYGNVELTALFAPIDYPIHYYLNGGTYPSPDSSFVTNRSSFTIETPSFILLNPVREGDIFVGWTGSNGNIPQLEIEIPRGSVGERIYYANYLRSGSEDTTLDYYSPSAIWSSQGNLYIRTPKTGATVRIYTSDGVLRHHEQLLHRGITQIPNLPPALYIVTLDSSVGVKIVINP